MLAAPVAASALNYTPIRQPATYDALPIAGHAEPVTTLSPSNTTSGFATVNLPFTYIFYSQPFDVVNVGVEGYLTFGTSGYNPTSGQAIPSTTTNQTIPTAAAPTGFIAPWWDDFTCSPTASTPGYLKTQTWGTPGSRVVVIEWDHCYQSSSSNTVQMQVWLVENSSIIKTFYGAIGATTLTNGSATVGIENAATYSFPPPPAAPVMTSTGGGQGQYGLLNTATPPTPVCTNNCTFAAWPTNTMIQYGRPTVADLAPTGPGLQITNLSKTFTDITAVLENNIENGGLTDATGVVWDYALRPVVPAGPDVPLPNCAHTTPETVPSARNSVYSITRNDTCTFALPQAGTYRICTQLDPQNTVLEAQENNNEYCTGEFVLGADLIGAVSILPAGGLGADTDVTIRVENRGSDPTAQFAYTMYWKDCASLASPGVAAYHGTATLAGGEFQEFTVPIYLAPGLQPETICAELVVDEGNAIDELVENNNTASTCVDPNKVCMTLSRPDLRLNDLQASAPRGCFFGDLVNLEAQVCNYGEPTATARGFGIRFNINWENTVGMWDTPIVSVPRECTLDSDCLDIGGGQPTCIMGLCHAPCAGNSNADCGTSGLECAEDPQWMVDGVRQQSCQLVLAGGQCKSVQISTNLPEINTFPNPDVPFADGDYFVGAIADFTDAIGEGISNEGNNTRAIANKLTCFTRKPDFQPTSVRTLATLGAGEVTPVERRVHNSGVVGGVFSYRYVLSSDAIPSIYDIPLEIEGRGQIADGTVEPFADSFATDMVRIPSDVMAGTYYLGIIVDPENAVAELSEDNNTLLWCDGQADASCAAHPITVVDSALRIVTPSLRDAVVGQSYNTQFLATGGNGDYRWFLTSGELPPGLHLEENGLLHGTVLEPGYFLFQVTVRSGCIDPDCESSTQSDASSYVIHATPARGPLAITTDSLPLAFKDVPYTAELGATGGTPPYEWSCTGLPLNWVRLDNNILNGTPTAVATAVQITCTVSDTNDQVLSRDFPLQVVNSDEGVQIRTTRLNEGKVGVEDYFYVNAEGGSGHYAWTFVEGTYPDGLAPVDASPRGALFGTPTVCGSFFVGVSVRDTVTGAADSAELPLTVICDDPRLTTRTMPEAVPNEDYNDGNGVQLETDSEGSIHFAVALGQLPLGLTLSETGLIGGKVAVDANPGDYNVAIEMTDGNGGSGLGALTIVVKGPPPDVTTVDKVTKGCSTTGDSSAAGFLPFAALFALLGFRRISVRRSAVVATLAAAAVLLPAIASAQTFPGYGMYKRSNVYQRLSGATPVPFNGTSTDDTASYAIDLPFTFSFYGEDYTQVYVNTNGLLTLSSATTAYTNVEIPTTATPNNFITPWWDDSHVSPLTDAHYLVRGTQPNREFVMEWLIGTGTDKNEMQVSLFENGLIAMRWGANTTTDGNGASIGMEDATGSSRSIAYLSCSPSCTSSDWTSQLEGTELIFTTSPNLRILSTSTLPQGDPGLEQEFTAVVRNDGPREVTTQVKFVASADENYSDDDFVIGTASNVRVPGMSQVTATYRGALPFALGSQLYYLLARADPVNTTAEFVETDNDGGLYRFNVRTPQPDLVIEWLGSPSSGIPGSSVSVDMRVANHGNQDAIAVPYWVVLSDSPALSIEDLTIHTGTVDVGWMETVELSDLVDIPADVPAGQYFLGVILDPTNLLAEFDELNNYGVVSHPFSVTVDGLRVATQVPPELQVGAPFCIPLVAEGGDGVYTWTIIEGQLPVGVTLNPGGPEDPLGASICGAASVVGIYDLTLQVESGGMTAESQLSLNVVAVPVQLTVASSTLPMATFNASYETGLSANGGRPPYRWAMTAGSLPAGLTLASDGLLFGTAREDGPYNLTVRVTDSIGTTATAPVRLLVAPPGRITCATTTLGTLPVGEEISVKLLAGGGKAPYTWTSESTQRFGNAGGDEIPDGGNPPGLSLDGDMVTRAPTEVGMYIWNLSVTDSRNGTPDKCSITLEVVAGQGLTVTTTALPLVLTDTDYHAKLEAAGGYGTLTWKVLGSGLPRAADGQHALGLSPAGVITGSLPEAELQGNGSRTYSFLVEVRDEHNNRGVGALSVTLTTPKSEGDITHETRTTETGCSTSAGGFSLVALGLVVLGLRRRR